jgi:hypothetical protein
VVKKQKGSSGIIDLISLITIVCMIIYLLFGGIPAAAILLLICINALIPALSGNRQTALIWFTISIVWIFVVLLEVLQINGLISLLR